MSSQYKTHNWVVTTIVTFQLIVFILLFIFFAQPDVLNIDWFVPKGGVLWSGIVTNNNIAWLNRIYPNVSWYVDANKIQGIRNINDIIFNVNNYYVLLGALIFTLLLSFLPRILHFGNFDIIPFTISTFITYIVTFFSCLIPVWDYKSDITRIILIIVISFFTMLISFGILNFIVLRMICNGKYSYYFAKDVLNENNQINYAKETYRSLIKTKNDQKHYIEVEEVKK